jgi:hypothetical protein
MGGGLGNLDFSWTHYCGWEGIPLRVAKIELCSKLDGGSQCIQSLQGPVQDGPFVCMTSCHHFPILVQIHRSSSDKPNSLLCMCGSLCLESSFPRSHIACPGTAFSSVLPYQRSLPWPPYIQCTSAPVLLLPWHLWSPSELPIAFLIAFYPSLQKTSMRTVTLFYLSTLYNWHLQELTGSSHSIPICWIKGQFLI